MKTARLKSNQKAQCIQTLLSSPHRFTLGILIFAVLLLSACGGNTPTSDTNPPTKPTGLSVTGGNQTITLQWNANAEADLDSYTLFWGTATDQLDNQKIVEKTQTSHSMNGLQNDSSYFFALAANDASGNVSEKTEVISVTPSVPDSTKPTVTLSSSENSVTSAGGITLSADATDDVAVSKVEFYEGATKLGEAISAPYSLEFIFTAADNGDHDYTAKAFDTSGNEAVSNAVSVNVNIQASGDTTAPTISVSSSQTNVTSASSIKLSATASDNVGVVKVAFFEGSTKLAEDGSQPYEFSLSLGASDNGSHTYKAKAVDAAGNEASADVTVSVNISTADTTVPSVNLSSSANSISPNADYITLTANASDNVGVSKVEFYQNDVLIFTSASSPYKKTVGLTVYNNGANAFKAIAYDTSGNTKTSNVVTVNVNVTKLYVDPVQGVMLPTSPDEVFKTMSEAAKVAKNGMTIRLEPGGYNAATGEIFPITFADGVHVQGTADSVIISGEGMGTGNGLIFAGSGELYSVFVEKFSKAVIAQGGTLELQNVDTLASSRGLELTGNAQVEAALFGSYNNELGVVLKDNSKLIMQKSSVSENEAGFSVNDDSQIELSNMIIEKNSSTGIALGANAKAYLNNVTLSKNTLALDLIVNNEVKVENSRIQEGQSGVKIRGSSKFTMIGGEISGMSPNCNADTYGISAGGTTVELSGVNIHDNLGYALAVGFSTKVKVVNSTFLKNGASGNCAVPYANTVVSTLASGELTLQDTTISLPHVGPNVVPVFNQNKMTITGGSVSGTAKICIYSSGTLNLEGTAVTDCETGIHLQQGTADFDGITVQNNQTSGIQFIQGSLKMFNSDIFNNGGAGLAIYDEGVSLGQIAICCGGTTIPGNNHIYNNGSVGVYVVTDEPGESFVVVANGNIWNANKQGSDAQGKYATAVISGPVSGLVGDNYRLDADTKIIR
jgi:Bacterial Ig domain/Protein of unknown function (DUF1565)/Fibronectin type III domain